MDNPNPGRPTGSQSLCVAISGWLLLAALALAPWATDGTKPWLAHLLNLIVAGSILLWAASFVSKKPACPRPLVFAGAALLLQAWWMTFNAFTTAPGQIASQTGKQMIPGLPGSVSRGLSFGESIQATLLIATLLLVSQLGKEPRWRQRLWWTMSITGTSIALFGLIQKLAGARGMFFSAYNPETETFFASFSYHGNAGSFLNLVWPMTAGLALLGFRDRGLPQRILWTLALVIGLAALFVNTSRAAGFLGVIMGLPLAAWICFEIFRGRFGQVNTARALITLFLLGALAYGMAMTVGIDRTLQRWGYLDRELTPGNLRLQAQLHELGFVKKAGPLGFGPGTYPAVFASHELAPDELSGFKQFAHEDYGIGSGTETKRTRFFDEAEFV